MNRVTEAEVKEIIDTSLTPLTPFIDTAHLMVDENLLGSGLTEAVLTKIELFLSAHLVTLREKQIRIEEFGDSKNEYEGKTGMGLESSHYGQTVLLLDTTGVFATSGNPTAEFEVI